MAVEITKENDENLNFFFKNIKIDLSNLDMPSQLLVTRELVLILKHCNFKGVDTAGLKAEDWCTISKIFASLVKNNLQRHYSSDSKAYQIGVELKVELTDEQKILINFLC